jgi:imidazolonepropionase-like amidohydrolase
MMQTRLASPAALGLLLCTCSLAIAADKGDADVIVLKARRIHTLTGEPIDGGVVIVRGGKIEAVGRGLPIPDGARVIARPDGVITPGLIDACCTLDPEIPESASGWPFDSGRPSLWRRLGEDAARDHDGPDHVCTPECPGWQSTAAQEPLASATPPGLTWAEQSSEVTPHRLVIDSVNLLSNDFSRLLNGGVTMVYVSADSSEVIGGRGTILKTAGPLSERVVRRADAVKASMGSDPSDRGLPNFLPPYYGPPPSILTRRPTTRMGVEWVFRKAFYDAQRVRDGLAIYGADMPPRQAIPVLQQVLAGEVPLRIQARMQHDIFTALRLAAEFHLKFTLEEATEAYRCLPQLKQAAVPVLFGPVYITPKGFRSLTDEVNRPRLNSPRQLADAGIEFALTAQELRDEEGLVRQAMLAVQNGLTPAQGLRAVTATPAALLGLQDQLGTIAPGGAADLVVWSTEPLDATSRPLVVLINGRVVLEEAN